MTSTAISHVELPSGAYADADFAALEGDRLFGRSWVHVASGHELAEPGDAWPVTVAGFPVLLIRQESGAVRAFHNVCRHRGSRLIDEPRRLRGVITCPYHAWSYTLGGALCSTPSWTDRDGSAPDGFDMAGRGLLPVRSAEWCDQVFVCLDADAPPFEDHIAPLARRWAHYDLALLRFGVARAFEVEANWKLVIENFLDTYHLPFVHPQFGPVEAAKRFIDVYEEPNVFGVHYPSGNAEKNKGDAGFPSFPGLTEEQRVDQDIVVLFPNTLLEIVAEHALFFRVEPLAPNRTRETLSFYFIGAAATEPEREAGRRATADAWAEVNVQDFRILRELQAAAGSPAARGLAAPSPLWEIGAARFRQRLAETLGLDGQALNGRTA